MNKLLLAAASLTIASTMVANATIVTTLVVKSDPTSHTGPALDVYAAWDLTAGPGVFLAPIVNWSVLITPSLSIPGASVAFLVTGDHLVNPFPGEMLPATFMGGILVPNLGGSSGMASGAAPHPGTIRNPADFWDVTATMVPYSAADFGGAPGPSPLQLDIHVQAWHVPEPGSYAMIAGLGLVGFAAFRRMRA